MIKILPGLDLASLGVNDPANLILESVAISRLNSNSILTYQSLLFAPISMPCSSKSDAFDSRRVFLEDDHLGFIFRFHFFLLFLLSHVNKCLNQSLALTKYSLIFNHWRQILETEYVSNKFKSHLNLQNITIIFVTL